MSDLALAHVRALDHLLAGGVPGVLNLGTGRGHSVREVLDAVAAAAGRPVPVELAGRRPGDPPELVARADAASVLLGEDLFARSGLGSIVDSALRWHRSDLYDRHFRA